MSTALAAAEGPQVVADDPVLSRWIRVASDGTIEVNAGKVELGQGIWTTQLQIAADELDIEPEGIRLRVGHTDWCPDQGLTAGSNSTEVGGMALRLICAEVRQLFVHEAAHRLGIEPREVKLANGRFSAGSGADSFGYHDLAAAVDLDRPARGDARPKAHGERRIAGASLERPDLTRKLFGAGFIHDIEWPGMLHGRVVRPPSYAARLIAFDDAALGAIRALPGVHTLHVDGRYIAVGAEREEQALFAADAVRRVARWQEDESLPPEAADQAWLRTLPTEDSVVHAIGSDAAADVTARSMVVDYSRPFLAHASIGPSCALARWDDARLTVCTHAQGSFTLRRELARYFELSIEHVTVIHADGAGCYGHNGADDAAFDAAILARAAGRPARMQWTREDELAWSPFGSAMSIRIEAGLDAQGHIVHWHHHAWSYTHVQRPGTSAGLVCLAGSLRDPPAPAQPLRDFPLPAGGGQRNAIPIYALPFQRIEYHLVEAPALRTSALRALGAYANVFAIESCIDELALLAGRNPLAFRLAHLADPRAIVVLQTVARVSDWAGEKSAPQRNGALRGRGMGFARYKNTSAYCAVVVEIEVAERIILDRVWAVVDAGEVVNPDGLVNQIEGGILQAASWTMKESVHWDRIRVTTRGWSDYPILGFDEIPRELRVQIIAHPELPPLGVGECAAGPTAAAIANALADAIGIRVRDLPLTPERLQRVVAAL